MTAPERPALARDPASFESLFTPILDRAFGLAVSLTRNEADAEDLVQDAALRAFRAFHSFEPGTNFKAWFYKILTNRHLERIRAAKRRPVAFTLDVDLDDVTGTYLFCRTAELGLHEHHADPGRLFMSKMTVDQVTRAIQALPDEYRIVAAFYFMEDMSYPEIAEMLDCQPGTVRSRLHRGRKMLQKMLWTIAVEEGIVAKLQGESRS